MTNKELILKLKEHLKKIDVDFDDDETFFNLPGWELGFFLEFSKNEELRDGDFKDVFTVRFKTKSIIGYDAQGNINSLMEGHYNTAYIDKDTYELIYILTHHGYMEPDGSF
jgi:hypothetical protein